MKIMKNHIKVSENKLLEMSQESGREMTIGNDYKHKAKSILMRLLKEY